MSDTTNSDRRAPLTAKQKDLLNEFRAKVDDLLKLNPRLDDDSELLRWIGAREWDVVKAEKMLRDHFMWRKNYGADELMDWKYPELFSKYFAGSYFGVDKEGYPTWFELTGRVDLKGMILSASKSDIIKYRVYLIEYLFANVFPECSKKAGRKISQCSVIVDMETTGLKYLSVPIATLYREFLTLVEANYPETLRTCYVINAPSILPLFYSMVKPFLAEYTRTKIRILGSNWKEALLKDYDADQLPVHWGGTRTDPDGDPYCQSQICLGGTIPKSLYLKNIIAENFDMSQFTTVTVTQGKLLELEYKIEEPGSLLRWNFWSNGNDVAFGVYCRKSSAVTHNSEAETVIPTGRVNSHLIPETGSVQCPQPGVYLIRFDNTYSWVKAKKISYLIEVLLPDNDHVPDEITNF